MSFLQKRTLPAVSPLDQIAELAKRKQEFGSLLKGDSISTAKTYFDTHLVPYLRDVFYIHVSDDDFYFRALSTDPSSVELAIRLLRHADRFGKDNVCLRFFDLFEGDNRFLVLHFNFSRSVVSSLDLSELDLAENLFGIYDKTGYLVPKLFAAHEIARTYYDICRQIQSSEDPDPLHFPLNKLLFYLSVLGDESLIPRARAEFASVSI